MQAYVNTLRTMTDPQTIKANIEQSLGPERISFTNVPTTSHFARVLLAADYQMKRLAMEFDPSPIRGLPGFLHMIDAGPTGHEQHDAAMVVGAEVRRACFAIAGGLAWELRGGSVKCMTEEDFLTAANVRRAHGQGQSDGAEVGGQHDGEVRRVGRGGADLRRVAQLHGVGRRRRVAGERGPAGEGGYSMPLLMSSECPGDGGVSRAEAGGQQGEHHPQGS